MTFHDISMKMLKVNFRRYRLYFLCNVFSVALFYSFAAIFTNKDFMNVRIVDSMISGNIVAPSLFVGIFLVLFIPYSNSAFQRSRKYEYGVLMTLGMSEREVLTNMLLENCVVAGISLISGFILGTAISFAFYFIIQKFIGVSGLSWYFNVDSYKWTAFLYGITILFTLVISILGFMKRQITDLIKDKFRSEKKGKSLQGLFIVGLIFVAVSILIMILDYRQNTADMWLVSLSLMFLGLYMIITQVEWVGTFFSELFPSYLKHHILELSFARQHHKSGRRIGIVAAWLIGFSIFFMGFCLVMIPDLLHNAATYSPYDMVYSRVFGMNKVEDKQIERLLNQNGVKVKAIHQVEYLRSRAFNILPLSQVNKEFKCNYQISKGKFLTVFQNDMSDGYRYDMTSPKTISFNCGKDIMELTSAGSNIRILFNRNPTFADRTLVLNDEDYNKIASKGNEFWAGVIKLYSFNNWKESGKGIAAVQKYLLEKNHVKPMEQNYYKATSKIETYTTAKQSGEFLLFLMFFIFFLFCAAANIMIHFKIKAESEEEQRMLSGLYRIGVTEEEMQQMLWYKNIYYYIPQVIIGLFLGVFYNYTVTEIYGHGLQAALYGLIAGMILVALQFVVARIYSRREMLSFDI